MKLYTQDGSVITDTSTIYTKSETDAKLNTKANSSDTYTKSQVYTKTETDTKLNDKANTSDVYTKTELDTKINAKANTSDVYTKTELDTKLGTKQDKLTAGTNVTISNNTISAKDTTYSIATNSVDGLMSKSDKAKLDGLSNYFVRMPYTLAKWAVGVDSESAPQYTPTDSELKTYMTTATSECGGKTPEQFISECLNNGYIMYYPSVRSLADRSSYYSHYFTIATVADYDRDYHRMWRYQFTGLNNNGFDFYIAWNLNEQYRWNEPFGEGGGGLACFTSDTLVLTEDGYKQIVNVKEGDKVYSLNENTNKIELKEIDKLVNHNVDDIYYIVLENELIKSSWSHPFYVEGKGKVLAKELKAGDNLKTKDGTLREIKAINVIRNQLTTVYEIRVKDNHNYYVGKDSILVYNEESIL